MTTPPVSELSSDSPQPMTVVRACAWTGLILGTLFIAVLGAAPVVWGGQVLRALMITGGAIGFLAALWWFPVNVWLRFALGYAWLGLAAAYLLIDDSKIDRPETLAKFSPGFPGAGESYEVLMRYGKNHPLGRDFRFTPPSKLWREKGAFQPKEPTWETWLLSNRKELETDWQLLEPVRDWWAELNTFERIADLTPPRADGEILAFAPIRALSQHACAIASLQALDGHGDDAIDTLVPMIEVSRKLIPSSRTLVRSMIAIVAEKSALETADFVLNATEVSPAARTRLAHALSGGMESETICRRLIGVEYVWASDVLLKERLGDLNAGAAWAESPKSIAWRRHALNSVGPLVYNPRRTLNLYADINHEMADLAARREFKKLEQRSAGFFRTLVDRGPKNLGGILMLSLYTPAYSKVVESFWKTEDLRSALYTRVKS